MGKELKKRVVIGLVVGIVGLSGVALGTTYFLRDYLPVTVLGKEYNYKDLCNEVTVDLEENNSVFDMPELNQFVTYNVDVENLLKAGLFTRIDLALSGKDNSLVYEVKFDKDGLRSYLENYNITATDPVDASIEKSDTFSLVSEEEGNKIDINAFLNALTSDTISITVSDYFIKPHVTKEDLEPKFEEIESLENWSCKYTNGSEIKSSPEYVIYDSDTGEISVDSSWISKAIRDILKSYSTVGIARDFTTHTGEKIEVSGGTWGSQPSTEKEVAYLTEQFEKGESITDRVPEYSYSYEDFTDTYIELSIADQHLWVYKDGEMIMETDVVTGDTTKKRDTPTGCYFISECINGKYLTGDTYKTWVNKWMRLTNTGIGLHDANWQPYFGGSRYKGGGSHGCINLPPKFASQLFDTVSRGWLVVIY